MNLTMLLFIAICQCGISFSLRALKCNSYALPRVRMASDNNIYNEMYFKKKLPQDIEKEKQVLLKNATATQNPNDLPMMNKSSAPKQYNSSTKSSLVDEKVKNPSISTPKRTSENPKKTSETKEQKKKSKLPLPFLNVESIRIAGEWVEKNGNFILKPKNTERPYGVIHFLGGAFVGAAPHITYRYLLESLSERGFLIVATPYRLDMDYVRICDSVLTKFDSVAVELASEYGPLPVIGIGHSCGALLQTLITSLFPDAPRALNVLISFNNRPAKAAIPGFSEFIIPFSQQLMGENQASSKLRERIFSARKNFDQLIEVYGDSGISPVFFGKEILPLFKQGVEILDQIPDLLKVISEGEEEFKPSPLETKEVCRRMYRARNTLLIKFENDDLDESLEIEKVLREANTIMRMKRPMIEMAVDLKVLTGTHITPLTPNVLLDPSVLSPVPVPDAFNPAKNPLLVDFMKTIDDVKGEIIDYLDVNILRTTAGSSQ